MQAYGGGCGLLPERVVEYDFTAVLAADVKDCAFGDGNSADETSALPVAQHFFQAHGLSAELNVIIVPASFLAAFEIDGIGN